MWTCIIVLVCVREKEEFSLRGFFILAEFNLLQKSSPPPLNPKKVKKCNGSLFIKEERKPEKRNEKILVVIHFYYFSN